MVSAYYSSTPEERDPQGMMQLPRNSSLQNIFLYREDTRYPMIIRSDNRTLHHVTLPCLYAKCHFIVHPKIIQKEYRKNIYILFLKLHYQSLILENDF